MHGGQKIVIFQHGRYIGQYMLSPPPFSTVKVKGTNVIVATKGNSASDLINFTKGPPKSVFLDGQVEEFYR